MFDAINNGLQDNFVRTALEMGKERQQLLNKIQLQADRNTVILAAN